MYDTDTPTRVEIGRSKEYGLTPVMRDIVIAMMTEEGRDFTWCEYRNHRIKKDSFEIHHTKYEGATYYDLMIVCTSCNQLEENKMLA